MRALESGTWIFGTATLAALALGATSKDAKTKSLLYVLATGTGIGAITMYLTDLSDQQHMAAAAVAARPPLGAPIPMPFPPALPSAGVPPASPPQPPAGAIPPPAAPATPPPATPPTPSSPPVTPPAPPMSPPVTPPAPTGPNAIGCTPLSGVLPPSAVAQARALLTLNPTAADERFRPSLLSVSTMRRLANDLRGCGSDLGFQPVRDALVKDLEDAAARFEVALASPAGVRPTTGALSDVLRFA